MKMKIVLSSVIGALMSTSTFAAEIKEGVPKTGMFMYANTVNIGDKAYSLPVLKSDDLICTTYISGTEKKGEELILSFAQYCDPVVEEPIELEDGSKASVITSASASTFYYNQREGMHKFTESDDEDVLEKVSHIAMTPSVYESFTKGFSDKVDEFISQRNAALSEMEKKTK